MKVKEFGTMARPCGSLNSTESRTLSDTDDSQFPHGFAIKRPEWLLSAYHLFLRTDGILMGMRRCHAVVMGLLAMSAMNLIFLYRHSPLYQEFWFSLNFFLLFPSLLLSPFTWMGRRHYLQKRNNLAKRFYSIGLAIDPKSRLVTHEAHARVVFEKPHSAVSFASTDIAIANKSD
jgi:hypothetical protein